MEPLSLAASIVAFVDVAEKLHGSLSKVNENRRRSRGLKEDVLRGIQDLEQLLWTHRSALATTNAESLRMSLKTLQRDMEYVANRCTSHRSSIDVGPLATAKAKMIAWLRRNDIEGELLGLEKRTHLCYNRLQIYTMTSMHLAVLRVEGR
ncbi:hypothetical protein HGRIS_007269 [Hohenbuehelia grisea]|uniref:Fungal N-terminal domain-containing protein n=1 Tax=Hohenbuehelia grisea TaxID=104357 RepID=A0ABR3JBN9_9AGAR